MRSISEFLDDRRREYRAAILTNALRITAQWALIAFLALIVAMAVEKGISQAAFDAIHYSAGQRW